MSRARCVYACAICESVVAKREQLCGRWTKKLEEQEERQGAGVEAAGKGGDASHRWPQHWPERI